MRIETPSGWFNETFPKTARIQFLLWLPILALLVLLPWRILSLGYLPDDDALRHAAKAVSGKPWTEILLLRPEITIDHNPGWHVILGWVYRITGWGTRGLVQFSVAALFLLAVTTPLFWLRKPEYWIGSLALMTLVFPYLAERLLLGRPFLVTVAFTLAILCLWTGGSERKAGRLAVTVTLFALATWIHGAWYLLPMLPLSFLLARRWKEGLTMSCCWAIGSVFGAALTGHPWVFLKQSALIPFLALGQGVPPEALVGEFTPSRGSAWAFLVIGAFLLWRKFRGNELSSVGRDPVFCLAVAGLLLGFRVSRFWLDWGFPALALWVARQMEALLPTKENSHLRLALVVLAGGCLWAGTAPDRQGRWTQYGRFECLRADSPQQALWLPGSGGILYAVDMSTFYHTFFCNPQGDWKYALGFEPTFMREEDRAVYFELCRTRNAVHACAPWVARMTPRDRLVLMGGPQIYPAIPELEWHYAAENMWVGRRRTP